MSNDPPGPTSLDPERHPLTITSVSQLTAQAMPFKLAAGKQGLKSVPIPDHQTQDLAVAAATASRQFGGLCQLSGEDEQGELLTFAVATQDPETTRRLRAFVQELEAEDD